MKGITPVIAIILLLLMAVAAAGGFYIVYQNFASSGEQSGSSQIEALGEQSLSQVSIESVAGGKIYLRNVGAATIDATKLTVYVENVPYSVNVSSGSIAENSRATLKFTQVPACSQPKCEVRISGAATASKLVDANRLYCSSDSECAYGEHCLSGICESATPSTCGNGVCEDGEYGYSCFVDCHPDSLLLMGLNSTDGRNFVPVSVWNGSTYEWVDNLTVTDEKNWDFPLMIFREDGTATAVSYLDWVDLYWINRDIWRSEYDGSAWSAPHNLTSSPSDLHLGRSALDINSTGDAVAFWTNNTSWNSFASWVSIKNGENSAPFHVDLYPGTTYRDYSSFAFAPNDEGYLFFSNASNGGSWKSALAYRRWNGNSWGETTILQEPREYSSLFSVMGLDFASDGNGIVAWSEKNDTNHIWLKYATYDGNVWTKQGNFQNWQVRNDTPSVSTQVTYDHEDVPMLMGSFLYNDLPYVEYTRYVNSAWTATVNLTEDFYTIALPLQYHDRTLFMPVIDYSSTTVLGRVVSYWTVWDGSGWSDFVQITGNGG